MRHPAAPTAITNAERKTREKRFPCAKETTERHNAMRINWWRLTWHTHASARASFVFHRSICLCAPRTFLSVVYQQQQNAVPRQWHRDLCVWVRAGGMWNVDDDNETHIFASTAPRRARPSAFAILMKHRVRRLIRYLRWRRMDAPFAISCCNIDWTESLTEWCDLRGRLQTKSKKIVNFWNNYNRVSYQRRCN